MSQVIGPLLACVADDAPTRATLVAKAQELGADIREKRQSGLEAEVLGALQQLEPQAKKEGSWAVLAVKREVERARDPDAGWLRPISPWLRVDERTIGAVLKGLGFHRTPRHGQGRSYTLRPQSLGEGADGVWPRRPSTGLPDAPRARAGRRPGRDGP